MKYMYSKVRVLSLLFVAIFTFQAKAQVYNDGDIRLQVWVHKVWSNANCDEAGNQNYVFRDIQVRVPNSTVPTYDMSPTGFNLRWDGENNEWHAMNQMDGAQIPSGVLLETPATKGYKIFDNIYGGTLVPNNFEYRIEEIFENDCGSDWTYQNSCGVFNLENDDNRIQTSAFTALQDFRAAPAGEVHYVQSEIIRNNNRDDFYGVVFAFQWDWVDPLLPLCSSPNYDDVDIDLDVELVGVWSDSDYDGGACLINFSGEEDLRMKFSAKDNIDLSFSADECVNCDFGLPIDVINQNKPKWNYVPLGSVPMLSRSYSGADIDMQSFTLDMELWEGEDGNGSCSDPVECQYNTTGINSDDTHNSGQKTISWRDAPPNIWNTIDLPMRIGTSQFQNMIVKVRYKYTMSAPTASIAGSHDRDVCIGNTTTISPTVSNATYYQWQVADDNSVGGPGCPAGAVWTDIPGEVCKDFTPPQTIGSKVYRLVVYNRTGAGSTSSSGSRYASAISECVRVNYFQSGNFAPQVNSSICGLALSDGASGAFDVAVPPDSLGFANVLSYNWTVTPSQPGIVISNPNDPSTNITFNTGGNGGGYNVQMTMSTPCGDMTSSCTVIISTGACGYIHVAPTGNDAFPGTATEPLQTIEQAMIILGGDPSRSHLRIAEGSYNLSSALDLPNNIIVEGGWTLVAGQWIKNTTAVTELNFSQEEIINNDIVHIIGFKSNNTNNWTLQDLTINTVDAVGQTVSGNGKSNYAVWANGSTGYTIARCTINAGAATNGIGDPNTGGFNAQWDGGNGGNGVKGGTGSAGGCGIGNSAGGSGGSGGSGGGSGTNAGLIGGSAPSGYNGGSGGAGRDDGSGANGHNGANGAGIAATPGGSGGSGGPSDGGNDDTPYGGNGGTGNNGANGADGVTVASGFSSGFFLPSYGTNGTAGGGGSGGGGGGGAGRDTGSTDTGGGGGSGGSGGGGGGGAGAGARGGGATFGVFSFGSSTGVVYDSNISTGNLGLGGLGGSGGSGGNGGVQSNQGNNGCSDQNRGGRGGAGGFGGDGGDGGDADNGLRYAVGHFGGGTAPTITTSPTILVNNSTNGGTVPTLPLTTVSYPKGCTNSVISFTKSSGTFASFGVDGALVDNVSDGNFLYPSNSADAYYTSIGVKDVQIGSTVFQDFVYIDDLRDLPEIVLAEDTVCNGDDINIASIANSPNGSRNFSWEIRQISSPYSPTNLGAILYSSNLEHPGDVSISYFGGPGQPGYGAFQIKFQVEDECCGFSIPVYKIVYIAAEPTTSPLVVGGGDYCFGGIGQAVGVNNTENGVYYELYHGGLATGQIVIGTGGNISFGNQTLDGLYEVYAYRKVGCEVLLNSSVTIQIVPTPTVFNVEGGGAICPNSTSGVVVSLDGSEFGTQYTLYHDNLGAWTPVASASGNGGELLFSPQTNLGDYYVIAQYLNPPGCEDTMQGFATITVSSGPTVYDVEGGGSYCIGDGGAEISLNGSELDVEYQLYYNASVAVGLPTAGTGNPLSFGSQTLEGNYFVVATDTNGCTATMNNVAVVSQLVPPSFDSLFVTEPNCFGANDGMIEIYATSVNGLANYVVNSDTSTNNLFTGISAGNYFVSVYDDSLCAVLYPIQPIQIDEPSPLTIAFEYINDATCSGGDDGEIGINVSGGSPVYNYVWTDVTNSIVSTAEDLIGFEAGTYKVVVSDANGCIDSITATIGEPLPLVVTTTDVDPTCMNAANGQIETHVSGGIPPYQYAISGNPLQLDSVFSGLTAGTYDINVIDGNNCTATISVTLTDGAAFILSVASQDDVSCAGQNDGEIILQTTGGQAAYSYSIDGLTYQVSDTFSNLPAGFYTFQAEDNNGCTASVSVTIDENPPLTVVLDSVITPSCGGVDDGAVYVSVNGGTGVYTYDWNTGAMVEDLLNAAAGTHILTVTDDAGCTATLSETISSPQLLTTSMSVTNPSCYGEETGVAQVSIFGGTTGYDIAWNTTPIQTGAVANNLAGDTTYIVTITDDNGCVATDSAVLVNPQEMVLSTVGVNTSCISSANGEVTVSVSGGNAPYNFQLNGLQQSDSIFDGLSEGHYVVFVEDNNNCTASAEFDINGISGTEAELQGAGQDGVFVTDDLFIVRGEDVDLQVEILNTTGNPIAGYTWSPVAVDDTTGCGGNCDNIELQPIEDILVIVEVLEEINGDICSIYDTIMINVSQEAIAFMPNAFSPNGDGLNDFFEINIKGAETSAVRIFNRWGEEIFYNENQPNGPNNPDPSIPVYTTNTGAWDGTFNGAFVPQGTYIYQIDVTYFDGEQEYLSGTVTVIR